MHVFFGAPMFRPLFGAQHILTSLGLVSMLHLIISMILHEF